MSSRPIRTFASIDGKGLVVRVLPSLEQHRPKHDQGDDKNDEDLEHLNLLRHDVSYLYRPRLNTADTDWEEWELPAAPRIAPPSSQR